MRKMSKAKRGEAAEAILSRLFDGWIPGYVQQEWVRETPNAKAMRWKSEPMTDAEVALLGEYR